MKREEPGPWPYGSQGAFSLTFDDGMSSQLNIAVPLLDKYGLKGTFYINPAGKDWYERLAPWREVARSGHEIGNHSLSHPCSCNFSGDPHCNGLENMTLQDIESDILEAQRRLQKVITDRKNWTFAYPCYQDFVGRGKTRKSYVPIVARHFVAARGLGETTHANSPKACDLHYLWSWPAQRMTGAQMIGLAERAAAQGRWGILTFHGVNEGHLPVSSVDLEEILAHLDRNRDRIWTAPIAEVAERILVACRTKRSVM